MKFLKVALQFLYRLWFYILLGVPILVMFPVLLLSISKEKWYPFFIKVARVWAKVILFGMGFNISVKREQQLEKRKSYMFIANHTSMTDIMLMLYVIKDNPFVFVGKQELSKIPIFGFFYKRTCILVDRGSNKSKMEALEQAKNRLERGLSICIFPEGGVPSDRNTVLDPFKDGAFRLALEYQIPIVPITFYDNKKRFSYDFFSGSPGRMRARIHKFIDTKNLMPEDKRTLKNECYQVIYKDLIQDLNK